jgi:hyperosmotically inducible protein
MKNERVKPVLKASLLFLALLYIVACGGSNNDPAIQNKIASVTQTTPEMQNVSGTVSNGVVTLVGQCKSEKDRERAEKAIKNIDDVKDVINNIAVTPELVVTSDSELRDGAAKVVKKYKHVQAGVENGVVTLRGNIDKDDLQQLMNDVNTLRPRRIENQLVVE